MSGSQLAIRRRMFRMVRNAGFYITSDNIALLGAGGLLMNGKPAPARFLEMNGWTVEDVARAITPATGSD